MAKWIKEHWSAVVEHALGHALWTAIWAGSLLIVALIGTAFTTAWHQVVSWPLWTIFLAWLLLLFLFVSTANAIIQKVNKPRPIWLHEIVRNEFDDPKPESEIPVKKGGPDFVVRILRAGFGSNGTDASADIVCKVRVVNKGTPGAICDWGMSAMFNSKVVYAIKPPWPLMVPQAPRVYPDGSVSAGGLRNELSVFNRDKIGRRLENGGYLDGVLQMAILAPLGDDDLASLRVIGEGPLKEKYVSKGPEWIDLLEPHGFIIDALNMEWDDDHP